MSEPICTCAKDEQDERCPIHGRVSDDTREITTTIAQQRNAMHASRQIGVKMCVTIAGMHAAAGTSAKDVYEALLKAQADQDKWATEHGPMCPCMACAAQTAAMQCDRCGTRGGTLENRDTFLFCVDRNECDACVARGGAR